MSPSLVLPHPQHQHHGPRQQWCPSRCQLPPHRSHSSSFSLVTLPTLYKLIHHYVLLVLATLIGLISLFAGSIPPAQAHAPPRTSHFEVNNPVRSVLAAGRFGRLPVSPYYASSYSRRYSPVQLGATALKDSKAFLGSGKSTEPQPLKNRPLMDPYYYYDYHRESQPREPLLIPSCKELRLMWLANHFSRFHSSYREHQQKGVGWMSHIPNLDQVLESVLQAAKAQQSKPTNKPTTTDLTGFTLTNSGEQNEIGQLGIIPKIESQTFGKMAIKPGAMEPPVYIAKIVPSRDFDQQEPGQLGDKQSAFGIIHTSPDDGDNDQEELVQGKSIRLLPSKSNAIQHNITPIDEEVQIDRNGNRAIFGKFIEADRSGTTGTGAPKEKALEVSNRTAASERKSVKVNSGGKPSHEQSHRQVSTSVSVPASRSRFQSNYMPGVWHNKPVIPSVRIL